MARNAAETANILSELYDENFGRQSSVPFRITWSQLRSLAGVPRLENYYLKVLSALLLESDQCLMPFDDFLFFAESTDLSHYRTVPDRILEQHLPNPEDIEVGDGEVEDPDDEI